MRNTISFHGKAKKVFDLTYADYENFILQKNEINGKCLNPGQVQFLRFPFLTSVISARRRREKVKRKNILFYYEVKHPQLQLFG